MRENKRTLKLIVLKREFPKKSKRKIKRKNFNLIMERKLSRGKFFKKENPPPFLFEIVHFKLPV